MKPKIITAREAAALIPSGSRVMFGGFIGCGAAHAIIKALDETDVENIEGVFDDGSIVNGPDGSPYYAWARLIHSGKIKKYIGTHVGSNPDASERWARGELELELVPQGSLAEMIRAGGMGIPGILTPTGIGTLVEESPWVDRKLEIGGKDYLLMKPLRADFALISGYKVDKRGNIWYKGTTRNFSPLMAMAADTVIVEAEHLVEVGEIEPENVVTPGILVDYIVVREEDYHG
ncbi:MAG: CoA transferase subunit A [Oscillospiraceae bacterium]|nr:CoA transferase subunit A [Oscillospiraceae bacterium]